MGEGSRNFETRTAEGWVVGSAKYASEEPHHQRHDGGAWTYETMHDAKREALLTAIIEGTGKGRAEVWLRWSEAEGYRLMRNCSGVICEIAIPEEVVLDFTADQQDGEDFDCYEATIERQAMMTHTHVGCRPHVGYVHCGAKLWGHHTPKAGRRHALNGGPTIFTALCGEKVVLEQYDDFGFRIEEPNNVRPVGHPEARPVTCKRCLRLIGRAG